MVTLRNPAPGHVVLGQQRAQLKDLQPGEDDTLTASHVSLCVCVCVSVWGGHVHQDCAVSSRSCKTTSFQTGLCHSSYPSTEESAKGGWRNI